MQPYELFTEAIPPLGIDCFSIWHQDLTIELEIKQNQEDMKEKKIELRQEDLTYLINKIRCDILPKYASYNKITEEITKLFAPVNDAKLSNLESTRKNLKPFDLEAARNGKPVCTRDGRKARIICFDRQDIKPIVALVTFTNDTSVIEKAFYYFEDGYHLSKNDKNIYDLMMLPEKKEGWVNVYKNQIHDTFESAEEGHKGTSDYLKTIRVEWEE